MRLGRFGYRDAAQAHFVDRHAAQLNGRGRLGKLALLALLVPVDLLWTLPRELRRAGRQGRLAQMHSYLRGLWDGWNNRPLPLRELGLR